MSGIHALVLAAGLGSRFGGGKLLAPWRGGVLLDGALAAALDAPVSGVTLVTGAQAEAVSAAASAFARKRGQGVRLSTVHAADYAHGLSASLKAGAAAVPSDTAGALVFLGDMPLVAPSVPRDLVRALEAGAPAACPVFEGRRGNPAALSRAVLDKVATLGGDRGARPLLDALGDDLVLVPSPDDGILVDVDRPQDLPR